MLSGAGGDERAKEDFCYVCLDGRSGRRRRPWRSRLACKKIVHEKIPRLLVGSLREKSYSAGEMNLDPAIKYFMLLRGIPALHLTYNKQNINNKTHFL